MGQKNNSISLRLASSTKYFDNSWYSDFFYGKLLSIDLSLYKYINNFFKFLKLPSTRLSIQHLPKTTKLFVFFCYPQKSREFKSKNFQIPPSLPFLKTKTGVFNISLEEKTISATDMHTKSATNMNSTHAKLSTFQINKTKTSLQQYFKTIVLLKQMNLSCKKKITSEYFQSFQKPVLNQTAMYIKYATNLLNQNNFNSRLSLQNEIMQPISDLKIKKRNFLKDSSLKLTNQENILKYLFLLNLSKNKTNNFVATDSEIKSHFNNLFVFLNLPNFKKIFNFILENNLIKSKNSFLFLIYLLNYIKNSEKLLNNSINLTHKNYLESFLCEYYKTNIQLIPFKTTNDWQSANYFADEIVYLLERRVSFRRLKSLLLKEITRNPKIRGMRILCSGRVGGKSKKAQRAKIESFKYGQTSLHVFSSKIDFAVRTAFTPLGSTGIKVWICYN